jgi:hypothetical protein
MKWLSQVFQGFKTADTLEIPLVFRTAKKPEQRVTLQLVAYFAFKYESQKISARLRR